jgi:hypothetical protein
LEFPLLSVKITLLTFQVPFSALKGIKRLVDQSPVLSTLVISEAIWFISVPDGPTILTATDLTPAESSEAETLTLNSLFALTVVG